MKDLEKRLEELEKQLGTGDKEYIRFIAMIPLEEDEEKHPPGLYWDDRPGCHAATLVFDPALGKPEIPAKYRKYVADHCLTVIYGLEVVPPPDDDHFAALYR
jgi:hypothetical protein